MKTRIRVGAVIKKNGSILLAKHKKGNEEYWLLPGGGVNPGETFNDALVREIKEEVSIKINVGSLIFVSESINVKDGKHIIQIVFEVEYISGKMKVHPDHRLCDAKYFKYEKFSKITLRPHINEKLLDYLNTGNIEKVYLGNVWR